MRKLKDKEKLRKKKNEGYKLQPLSDAIFIKTPRIAADLAEYGSSAAFHTTYDDATRMIDFCHDDQGSVSRQFYDWYLQDKPEYFMTTGTLVIEGTMSAQDKMAVSFDLSDPNETHYVVFSYNDRKVMSRFIFKRQENLTLEDINVEMISYTRRLRNASDFLVPPEAQSKICDIINQTLDIAKMANHAKRMRDPLAIRGFVQQGVKDRINKELYLWSAKKMVHIIYAILYYVPKQEKIAMVSGYPQPLEEGAKVIKETTTYKYNGYIDINRIGAVYKPIVMKDPQEPIREYNRHIQAWSVRGHYRKNKNGSISWVAQHTKGKGELESRAYGTLPSKDVSLQSKVYKVERPVKEKPDSEQYTFEVERPVTEKFDSADQCYPEKEEGRSAKITVFAWILSFINRFTKHLGGAK